MLVKVIEDEATVIVLVGRIIAVSTSGYIKEACGRR